ncbi:MAG: Rid family detoxifying hydrolase [Clostridium sp.]|nr:Rid family detoxifying hydrolase [Clostridium sp.]
MSTKKQINCQQAPSPAGPYSQGIIGGPFVFVAGQRPVDPATGNIGKDIGEQTAYCLKNIEAILREAGSSLKDVVKTNVFLSDLADFDAMNEVYREMMPAPYPARTTVGTVLRGILIEIEAVAMLNQEEE